jgi:hypothetical protein
MHKIDNDTYAVDHDGAEPVVLLLVSDREDMVPGRVHPEPLETL